MASEPPPELKDLQSRLYAASDTLKKTYTIDLLSISTRGERDRLLLISITGLAFAIVPPEKIAVAILEYKTPTAPVFLAGIALIIIYFCGSLLVGLYIDRKRYLAIFTPEVRAFRAAAEHLYGAKSQSVAQSISDHSQVVQLVSDLSALRSELSALHIKQLKDVEKRYSEDIAHNRAIDLDLLDPRPTKDMIQITKKITSAEFKLALAKQNQSTTFKAGTSGSEFEIISSLATENIRDFTRLQFIQMAWLIALPIILALASEIAVVASLSRVLSTHR